MLNYYWDVTVMELCKKLGSKAKIKAKKILNITSKEKLEFLKNYVKKIRENFKENVKFFQKNKYYLIDSNETCVFKRRNLKKDKSVKFQNDKLNSKYQTRKVNIGTPSNIETKMKNPKNVVSPLDEDVKKTNKKETKMQNLMTEAPKLILFPPKEKMSRLIFELAGIHF